MVLYQVNRKRAGSVSTYGPGILSPVGRMRGMRGRGMKETEGDGHGMTGFCVWFISPGDLNSERATHVRICVWMRAGGCVCVCVYVRAECVRISLTCRLGVSDVVVSRPHSPVAHCLTQVGKSIRDSDSIVETSLSQTAEVCRFSLPLSVVSGCKVGPCRSLVGFGFSISAYYYIHALSSSTDST